MSKWARVQGTKSPGNKIIILQKQAMALGKQNVHEIRAACPKDKLESNLFLLAVFKDLLRNTWSQLLYSYFKKNQHFFIIFIKEKLQ